MSPEQASGKPLDHRSDLYSAACVICEMLCGEAPFASRTAQVTMARRLTEDPGSIRTVRPSISPGIDSMLLKSLSRLPADRFQSAEEMAAALRRGPEDSDVGALTSTSGSVEVKRGKLTFWEEMRRRKVWSAGVVYAGVAYAIVGLADIVLPIIERDVAMRPLVALALAGLPVVLLLAWAFEIAPEEGVRKTGAWQVSQGSDGRSWPVLSTSAKLIVALVLAALAMWYLAIRPLLAS